MKSKKPLKSKRRITVPSGSIIPDQTEVPQQVQDAFRIFLEYHSAKRLSRNLRCMLLRFLMHDGATESLYLKDLLFDLEGLFTLLEIVDENSPASSSQFY